MNKEHELRVEARFDSFGAGKDVALGLKSSWNLENIGVWAGNKQEPKDTLEYIHYTHGKKEFRKEAQDKMLSRQLICSTPILLPGQFCSGWQLGRQSLFHRLQLSKLNSGF